MADHDHDVRKKYRLFHPQQPGNLRNGWQDSVTANVNVDVNADVTIGCNEGEGWSEHDSKSGKSESAKCKSGKSKSAKSKSAKVETYWPTYTPTRWSSIVSPTPTFKPTKRPTTKKPTPTPISSSQKPTPATSPRPTKPSCIPLDPNPYSFEPPNNVFPKAPWTTGGDGKWEIDSTSSHAGKYSIRSPSFDGSPVKQISNATLTVCDDYEGGPLTFRVLSSVLPPQDNFIIYVDGTVAAQVTDVKEFTEVKLALNPGPHRVDFSYQYNTFNLDPLPPVPPEILGAVWLDSVSLGNVLPPGSKAPTLPPATAAPIIAPTSKSPTSKAPTVSGTPITTASPTPLKPLVSLQPTPNTTQPNTTTSPTILVTTANPANISPTPPSSNVPTPSGGPSPTSPPTLPPTPPPNVNPSPTPLPTKIPTFPPTNPPTPPPNPNPPPPSRAPTQKPTKEVSLCVEGILLLFKTIY